jgi:hypothetical protein
MGIAVGPGGRVIVAYMERPAGRGNVLEVDLQTAEHRVIVPDPDLVEPASVALEASGDVIVTEPDDSGRHSRLHRFMRSGSQQVLRDGPTGHRYSGVSLNANGDILVGDLPVHDPGRVLRFDRTGQDMQTLAVGENLVLPAGIAVDRSGAIIVANSAKNVIRIERASGAQTPVSAGGSLESPTGVAIR